MRILLTTDTVGGVWTFTKELTIGLLDAGHSVALASFGGALSQEQAKWCSHIGTKYGSAFRSNNFLVPLEWMPNNKNAYAAAEPSLLHLLDDFAADLLHSAQYCFGHLPVSVPKIITAHSDVLSWGAACRPSGLEPSEWLTQYRFLVQTGLDGANAVVAPTQWMLNALKGNFGFSCPTEVILNGRSLDRSPDEQIRKLQAVSAGRLWDEGKNIAVLAKVRSPFPILLAGDQKHNGNVVPQFHKMISFVGQLDENGLFDLFHTSIIYLATSIYEPFGLAPLEAALSGCAVLANDIPSFREIWGDAILYFKDAESISDLLAEMEEKPEILELFRDSSMRRARQLTRSRMVESYIELYASLISRHRQKPAYQLKAYA